MPTYLILKRPFVWALTLLIVSTCVCGYIIYRSEASERWLHHTYEVQLSIGGIQQNLSKAGRSRSAYIESGDPASLQGLAVARDDVARQLNDLRRLVSDSSEQLSRCDALHNVVNTRMEILQRSIALKQSGQSDLAAQAQLTTELVRSSFEAASIVEAMQQSEDALLRQRSSVAASFFSLTVIAVFATFLLSALLFWINDRMLSKQLRERQAAERSAQLLSTALMRTQDEERRKFSRELHDSLGQTLAAAKMLADSVNLKSPDQATLDQLSALLEDAIKETRTLSQLLHPPLLEEVGFLSAARWFLEEFSQRTDITVDFKHDPDFPELLPKSVELTLFRILQEALTNVHRHSKSPAARIQLNMRAKRVNLLIGDKGIGIPNEKLHRFQANGSGVGVGLAGMRNRVREQGGTFSLSSGPSGTTILVEIPTDYALNEPAPREAVPGGTST
jgi:signal transduction histidine kinase